MILIHNKPCNITCLKRSPLTDQYDTQHIIGKPHELWKWPWRLTSMDSECQSAIVCLKQNEQMEILGKRLRVWREKHLTSVTNLLSWTFFTSEAEIPVKQETY
jgi:hypothetical protein